ncbi:MAG: homoserine dehydrogenase [Lachnospiraceae bacterium]|nr:homoserine dehydrogenase [Lachnospiraceae bacterium]
MEQKERKMDYTYLFKDQTGKQSKVAVVGATRGYGYTLLAQIPKVKLMELRAVCSRHPEECIEVLLELGYDKDCIVTCESREEINQVDENGIIVVRDYRLIVECGITAMVECTGNTGVSIDVAVMSLTRGINVYMVSKETDSVCGPALNQLAIENDAVYALVNGDQPRNLVDLYSWAMLLGLEIVAAGKSSEYDFVWDRETGELSYTDGISAKKKLLEMLDCWRFKGVETLEHRRRLLEEYTEVICADLCEMNLVSNVTGLVPARPTLDYPIAKPSELADIFIPEEDGGILKKTGVVDVFYNLRGTDEASFSGGEFIIVKCDNDKVWDMLRGKGHVQSRNKKYACIYYPYHFMGLESPITILLGDFQKIGTHPECRQVSVLSGVAQKNLPKGTKLMVTGHHHEIIGLVPELLEKKKVENLAPYYLLNGTTLLRDVKEGEPITLDDVELSGLDIYKLYRKGLELS